MKEQSTLLESPTMAAFDVASPKVSIIVPVYNGEQNVALSIDSVLGQTIGDFELICINDGSTDSSLSILEEYARKDSRIKVMSQENQGQSKARNVGLDQAKGEYIFFLDSDDTLAPYALEVFLHLAAETKGDVVVCDQFLTHKENFEKAPHLNYRMYTKGLKDFLSQRKAYSSVWNKLYRAESLKDLRFTEGIVFEDWPFLTLYFNAIKSYAVTSLPLYYYYKAGSSTVRSPFSEFKIRSYATGIRSVGEFYKDKPDYSVVKKRMHVAMAMCINAAYRDKVNRARLAPFLCRHIDELRRDGFVEYWRLPIKTLWRLYRLNTSVSTTN